MVVILTKSFPHNNSSSSKTSDSQVKASNCGKETSSSRTTKTQECVGFSPLWVCEAKARNALALFVSLDSLFSSLAPVSCDLPSFRRFCLFIVCVCVFIPNSLLHIMITKTLSFSFLFSFFLYEFIPLAFLSLSGTYTYIFANMAENSTFFQILWKQAIGKLYCDREFAEVFLGP